MKLLRKVLLPGLIAASFLGFLGAVGTSSAAVVVNSTSTPNSVVNTSAGPGDVCSIIGPQFIKEGETHLYLANIQSIADAPGFVAYIDKLLKQFLPPFLNPGPGIGGIGYAIAAVLDGTTTDVDLDDSFGDSDITSIDKDGDGDTEAIPPTDHLNAIEQFYGANTCGLSDAAAAALIKTQLVNYMLLTYTATLVPNTCLPGVGGPPPWARPSVRSRPALPAASRAVAWVMPRRLSRPEPTSTRSSIVPLT